MLPIPVRTLAETDRLLIAPGQPHETRIELVNGRLQTVYKRLWPSLRAFWLESAAHYNDDTYIVFEDQRLTYSQVSAASLRAAHVLQLHDIKPGDRIAIASRNFPEYLVIWWACHLVGAVAVLVNAWLPLDALQHSLVHTQSKIIFVDPERADRVEPAVARITERAGTRAWFVIETRETTKTRWRGMAVWDDVLAAEGKGPFAVKDPGILPEDNAAIIFTSGTSGLPKGVLSTQRMFLTNVMNLLAGGARAALRRGEEFSLPFPVPGAPQKGLLVSVPIFHVTGSTSLSMVATFCGSKIVLMRKWAPKEAIRLIKRENITMAGGVPSMVADIVDNTSGALPLESLIFGGASPPDQLPTRATAAFPNIILSQGYGLTETNSIAVSVAGEDYLLRPTTAGRASPVNEILIMSESGPVPTGETGEVWLRGPNVMKGYWRDPIATAKAIKPDGWLATGDLGLLDHEGFLYIRDRIKDLIIRGGENIASVMVENALYADLRVSEAAAVGVPDRRLGELVTAVVSTKPLYHGQVHEEELIEMVRKSLPRYAVPVMVLIVEQPFALTPSGKILKQTLRRQARDEWERRIESLGAMRGKL